MKSIRELRLQSLSLISVVMLATTAFGQLQITEVMFDSESAEPRWEWFEVRNTGAGAVDLNGAYVRDLGGNEITAPNIDGSAGNTMIPSGSVGVVFNATSQDEGVFRQAWNLASTVPLIGITGAAGNWSSLNNSGDHFGIWANATNYQADLGQDMDGNFESVQFNNALVNLDYNEFPDGGQGISSYWTGSGDVNDGTQWATSAAGVDGAYQSSLITMMDNINSTDDVGNPGLIPGGVGSGLQISEIMYNPRSTPEGDWEWIEVVNNTGAAIDFASQSHFLDDESNGGLLAPNITQGSIANGGVAILYNEENDAANFTGAWGAGINAIPVSDWSALNNGGDTIGIWDNQSDYDTDAAAESFDNTVVSLLYSDDPDFPADDGNGSIWLTDLSADATNGANYQLSFAGDGVGSFNAAGVGGIVTEHNGNDFGSPGIFGDSNPPAGGDFNGDGIYDCADIDALVGEAANGSNTSTFDLTGDGIVDRSDVQAWLAEAGEENIGPGRTYLEGDANLDGSVDVGDFNIWNGSKFTATAEWCNGDFNADGSVDVGDFNIWNGNKFQSSDVSTVPEPGSFLLMLAGLPLLLRRRK